MSSEAITRNDLKNILNEVLPPTPSEYKKLLWTNNSNTTFAAQTISLNLTGYDCVEVWFYTSSDVDPLLTNVVVLEVGQKNRAAIIHSLGSAGVNENTGSRQVVINSNGVVFSNYTYKNRRSGGTLTTANEFAVPYKIYGVKYERVNPPQVEVADCIVEQGTSDIWTYRKWNSGIAECWGRVSVASRTYTANGGYYNVTGSPPTGLFVSGSNPVLSATGGITSNVQTNIGFTFASDVNIQTYLINRNTSAVTNTAWVCWHLTGRWK